VRDPGREKGKKDWEEEKKYQFWKNGDFSTCAGQDSEKKNVEKGGERAKGEEDQRSRVSVRTAKSTLESPSSAARSHRKLGSKEHRDRKKKSPGKDAKVPGKKAPARQNPPRKKEEEPTRKKVKLDAQKKKRGGNMGRAVTLEELPNRRKPEKGKKKWEGKKP